MQVRFWGARGSLPASANSDSIRRKVRKALELAVDMGLSDKTAIDSFIDDRLPFWVKGTYGTNTSCVEIRDGTDLVLCDAGSGLRDFGNHQLKTRGGEMAQHYHILMSHLHWDHIQGFPFFGPAMIPGNKITIYSCHAEAPAAFSLQHSAPFFPLYFSELSAGVEFVRLLPGKEYPVSGFTVTPAAQAHPGDSYGYRLQRGGKTVIYSTDSEHKAGEEVEPFIAFIERADLLIFDAQYTLVDAWTTKSDWGHSSNVTGVELAQKAGVKHLCLFHTDPMWEDEMLDRVLSDTRRLAVLLHKKAPLRVSLACDGLVIDV